MAPLFKVINLIFVDSTCIKIYRLFNMDLITNLHVELQKVTEELEALERHVLEQEDEVGRLINLNNIHPEYPLFVVNPYDI